MFRMSENYSIEAIFILVNSHISGNFHFYSVFASNPVSAIASSSSGCVYNLLMDLEIRVSYCFLVVSSI